MKTFLATACLLALSSVAFSQSTNTSMTLPSVAAESEAYTAFADADYDEEIPIDRLFEKMALIESLVFSEKELNAIREEHRSTDSELLFFGQTN